MVDLTVDTTVLVFASTGSDAWYSTDSITTLDLMLSRGVALSWNEQIGAEYDAKLTADAYAKQWFRRMVSNNLVTPVAGRPLPSDKRRLLEKARIHKEDRKFVLTAAASVSRTLVATDAHVTGTVAAACCHKHFGVTIWFPSYSARNL